MINTRVLRATLAVALVTANTTAFAAVPSRPTATEPTGQGWQDAFTCVACMTAGGLAIYGGAAAWGLLIMNSGATAQAIETCVESCVSAYGK